MTDQRGLAFDSASDLYQQARPEYPEQLYEAMIAAAGLGADDRLLEIGCASGKATLPLARRGFRIICVEPGSRRGGMPISRRWRRCWGTFWTSPSAACWSGCGRRRQQQPRWAIPGAGLAGVR